MQPTKLFLSPLPPPPLSLYGAWLPPTNALLEASTEKVPSVRQRSLLASSTVRLTCFSEVTCN